MWHDLVIPIIILSIFTFFGSLLAKKFEKSRKTFVNVIAAVLGFLAIYLTNYIDMQLSKPVLFVETSKAAGKVDIKIRTDRSVEYVNIIYPIIGRVTEFVNHSLTDASTSSWVIGSLGSTFKMNDLEILIENITPQKALQYTVYYENNLKYAGWDSISFAGSNIYKAKIAWFHKGDKKEETQWRLINNDSLTSETFAIVKNIQVSVYPSEKPINSSKISTDELINSTFHIEDLLVYGGDNLKDKNFKEAERAFKAMTVMRPKDPRAWLNHGISLRAQNNDQAEVSMKKAIDLNNSYFEAYERLGEFYFSQKEYQECVNTLEKAIEIEPKAWEIYYALGSAFWRLNKYSNAIEMYKNCISLTPDSSAIKKSIKNIEILNSSINAKK